jgi:hypothetical protein
MALKLVLMLPLENGVILLQIYSDSLLIIEWMKGEFSLRNFTQKTVIFLYYEQQMNLF